MTDGAPLAMEFIEKHPIAAASALTTVEPNNAAAFLNVVPTRFVAKLFSHMASWPASILLAKMSLKSAGAALKELDFEIASACLRLIDKDVRERLLSQLPEKLKRDFEASLTYPEDSVGGQMTTQIVVLGVDQTVLDATTAIRKTPHTHAEVIFVADRARKFAGAVGLSELLRHSAKTKLGEVMNASVVPLSARARLGAVVTADAWRNYASLPVVDRHKTVIGALSRAKAIQDIDAAVRVADSTSIAGSIASAFFASGIGLARLLTDIELSPKGLQKGGNQS